MTIFETRRKGCEALFARKNEESYYRQARALRHIGLWAAATMGKAGHAAEDYVSNLLGCLARASGVRHALQQVETDLQGLEDAQAIRQKFSAFMP